MALTPDEQIKKLDDEITQLKAKKQALLNREKQRAKKERTRRLIQYGEIVEKYLKGQTPEQLEELLKNLFGAV